MNRLHIIMPRQQQKTTAPEALQLLLSAGHASIHPFAMEGKHHGQPRELRHNTVHQKIPSRAVSSAGNLNQSSVFATDCT